MIRVLADLHHGDLYYSLQLLLEQRFGWELYRPIGLDWYKEGYWAVYPHPHTAKQYLSTGASTTPLREDGLPQNPAVTMNDNYLPAGDGIYYTTDSTKGKINRGITLDRFKNMDFDILISSIPNHIKPFKELIAKYQPGAKHVFQIGNSWTLNQGVKNIMASCAPPTRTPKGINVIFYHQEFDLDVFNFGGPAKTPHSIYSFIHYMQQSELLDVSIRRQLPSWDIRLYGAGMQNGSIHESTTLADTMKRAGFIWHVKPGGDGFGHIVHNSYAVGRPIITYGRDYHNKLAGRLLVKDETYIELDEGNLVPRLLEIMNTPGKYEDMCHASHAKFKEVVDYDREAEDIGHFFNNLK